MGVMKFAILNDTVNREKNASADVQALTREYATEKDNRRVEVERRDATIRKLREDIVAVREASRADRDKLLEDIDKQQVNNKQEYESRHEKLKADLEQAAQHYDTAKKKCVASEDVKRRERAKREK